MTQCQHCRQERKKRSAHVSCDCGQPEKQFHPKEKCIHLREAEEKVKAGGHREEYVEKDAAHLARIAEEQGCCCGHGGKCTCALLIKEAGDGSSAPHGPAVKPKLEKATSEGSITVFQNGHHKPVHRKNHAAHECGMPYKIPMTKPTNDQTLLGTASRSVDNLTLDSNQPLQPSPFKVQNDQSSFDGRRQSKSEQHSPKASGFMEGCSGFQDARVASIDFSTLSQIQTNQSLRSTTSDAFDFPSFEPVSGMTDSSFDPWSTYPSADSVMPNNNPFGVWPTSTEGVHLAQPALTVASSGTTSEIDEIPPMEDTFDFIMPSIQEDMTEFQTNSSPRTNRRSLPPDMFGNIDFVPSAAGTEWQNFTSAASSSNLGKGQTPQIRSSTSFDQTWQTTGARPLMTVAQHQLGGLPKVARPQSRSVGPYSAPPDDIMSQLFPEIDVSGTMFASSNSQTSNAGDLSGPTMDFGSMDETMGFTTQPWSDGSLSIPIDMITSPYAPDQDYSTPDFTANWTQ